MSDKTSIEWCDHTFNPWWGCHKVGPECDFCYAERDSKFRYHIRLWGPHAERRFFGDQHWRAPYKWNEIAGREEVRRRVFCASYADVFEDYEGEESTAAHMNIERSRLWSLIEGTPMLDWLLLTKRPQNIARMIPREWLDRPKRNVWLGTSVGVVSRVSMIDHLLDVPAAVHFVSYEPALELVDFRSYLTPRQSDGRRVTWLIAGGESGGRARIFNLEWARAQRMACEASGVAFFMKQIGRRPIDGHDGEQLVQLRVKDKKGGDPDEWPEDLRVRQFPTPQMVEAIQ